MLRLSMLKRNQICWTRLSQCVGIPQNHHCLKQKTRLTLKMPITIHWASTIYFVLRNKYYIHLLRNLDTGKANGPDNISARMLKETASSIAPSLTCLFNLSIAKGQLYYSVVPIPKSSNNKHSPSGYRPISLLPIVSKLLEKQHWFLTILMNMPRFLMFNGVFSKKSQQ
jgi:hypothetical protein